MQTFIWGTNDQLANFSPKQYEKYQHFFLYLTICYLFDLTRFFENYWNPDIAFKDKSNFSYDTIGDPLEEFLE